MKKESYVADVRSRLGGLSSCSKERRQNIIQGGRGVEEGEHEKGISLSEKRNKGRKIRRGLKKRSISR